MPNILNSLKLEEVIRVETRKMYLKENGLTVRAAARRLGTTEGFISQVLRNNDAPDWAKIGVAKLANVEFEEFWGEPYPDFAGAARKKLSAAGLTL